MAFTDGVNDLPVVGGVKFSGIADGITTGALLWVPRSMAAGDALATKFVPGVGLYVYDGATTQRARQTDPAGAAQSVGIQAAGMYIWHASSDLRAARSIGGLGDANAGATTPSVGQMAYNALTYDRVRNNTLETLLASAARTASTVTAALTNYNGRGVHLDLAVSAKAAATTLTAQIINTGNAVIATSAALAATVGQTYSVQFYPGVIAADFSTNGSGKSVALPRSYSIQILHSDANSVTYSLVGMTLL